MIRPLVIRRCLVGLVLVGEAALAGCLAGDDRSDGADKPADETSHEVALASRYTGSQCGGSQSEPRVRAVGDPEAFAVLRDAMGSRAADELGAAPDFSETLMLWISMGQRRSGGYAVTLRDSRASVVDGALTVPVDWRTPGEHALTASVITHPCLILIAPRGGYDSVRVVDQQGVTRLIGPGARKESGP